MAGIVADDDATATEVRALKAENQELCRRIDALEARLEEKSPLLVPYNAGPQWRQEGVKTLPSTEVFDVNIILVNDRTQPITSCRLRVMVDTRCNAELVIPRATAQKLRLIERKRYDVEGFEKHGVHMIEYAPALVQLPYMESYHLEPPIFTQADMTVMATGLPSFGEMGLLSHLEQNLTPDGDLQLSNNPQGSRALPLLGAVGLRKLGVGVKPAGGVLYKTNPRGKIHCAF